MHSPQKAATFLPPSGRALCHVEGHKKKKRQVTKRDDQHTVVRTPYEVSKRRRKREVDSVKC